jgi:tetratricopeptide (TPR) repeat protein
MDTLSFSFLTDADDSLDIAQSQFLRREYGLALDTIARMPELLSRRADVLELKAKACQGAARHLEAVAAWEELLRVAPENKAARTQLSLCYAKVGVEEVFKDVLAKFRARKYADAMALLDAGAAHWENLAEFHRLRATMHERLGQYDRALASWNRLAELAPEHIEACNQIPVCHAVLGHTDEAWQGFRRAAEKHPANVLAQFNLLFFELKQKGASFIPIALLEVERIRAVAANSPDFKTQMDMFRERVLSLHDPEVLRELDHEGVLQLSAAAADAGESMRSIYEQFEPLGNNCEFGDAQRKHGAEPLALFRWTSINPSNLVRLLRDRLEGFDEPRRYRLEPSAESEYILKEDVYATASHTRVKVADVPSADALLAQLSRRQSFLKRKLLETLEEGRKIFVYKADKVPEAGLLDQIEEQLIALGARKVLFVLPQDDTHAGGTVHAASATRVVGFLSDFMPNTQFAQWDAIVRQAHLHFNAR